MQYSTSPLVEYFQSLACYLPPGKSAVSPCHSWATDQTERSSDSFRDPPSTWGDKPAQCTAQDDGHVSGARADEDQRLCVSTAASDTVPSR